MVNRIGVVKIFYKHCRATALVSLKTNLTSCRSRWRERPTTLDVWYAMARCSFLCWRTYCCWEILWRLCDRVSRTTRRQATQRETVTAKHKQKTLSAMTHRIIRQSSRPVSSIAPVLVLACHCHSPHSLAPQDSSICLC